MLHGFRWQLVALLLAIGIFAATLITRLIDQPASQAEPTPEPAISLATITPIASPTPLPPLSTPLPNPVGSSDRTFTEGLVGSLQRLNPLLANLNPVDSDITSLIFEGLTGINEYGEPVPALAQEWVISGDGLDYAVVLRDDVMWHTGVPFTADDVIYTMSLLADPDFPGDPAVGEFWRTVEVRKLSAHVVRFRLAQPLGSFLYRLTVGILPVHVLDGTRAADLASHPFNLSPVGTGPYQLEALRTSSSSLVSVVDLQPAPTFQQREGVPADDYAISRIRFQLFESFEQAASALNAGQIDGLAGSGDQQRITLINASNSTSYTTIAPRIGILIFNWDDGDNRFFDSLQVRQALQTGLNRATPVERHLGNQAVLANSPMLPGSWVYRDNLPWPNYDPAVARGLIEQASIRVDDGTAEAEATEPVADDGSTPMPTPEPTVTPEGMPRYRFSILVPDIPSLRGIAEEIAAQWSQYVLEVTVEAVGATSYQERIDNGDFQAALVELELGSDPDVYPYWHQGQYPDGLNYGGTSDDILSEMLERARREHNGINRAELYARFQREFVERAVALPLYYPLYTYAVRDTVEGVQLGFIGQPSDRLRTIAHWRWAGQ